MPDVTVADIASTTTVGAVAVNRTRTMSVSDVAAAVTVEEPYLYIKPSGTVSKAPITLTQIPVQEGYSVRPVSDFTTARLDGGISLFREDRQYSQPVWKIRAKFVFPTEAEYSQAVSDFLSGLPFETDLVVDTTYSLDTQYPGEPFRCWPVPKSVKLVKVNHIGYEVALEFYAIEVP